MFVSLSVLIVCNRAAHASLARGVFCSRKKSFFQLPRAAPEVMEKLTEAQQELFDWLVLYIRENQHPPSIRQMMRAMELRSPAPVQSRLKHLQKKGYIDWNEGRARTIRVLTEKGIPLQGAIAAGSLIDVFPDSVERLDLSDVFQNPQCYALRVRGDSMIDAHIAEGDIVIMQQVKEPSRVKNGTIVAARYESQTTLKAFHRDGDRAILKPANPSYEPIVVPAEELEIQGVLVGVWRGYGITDI